MKRFFKTVLDFALILIFFSCKKDGSNSAGSIRNLSAINQSSIIGKWNIITDSTYTGFVQYQQPFDYVGKPGDYFDFRTDGNVYTKEGDVLDTLAYSFKTTNQVIIASFGGILNGVHETSSITSISANQIVIFAPWIYTPGGVLGRKVTLSN